MEYGGISLQNQRRTNMDGVLLKTQKVAGKTAYLAVVCDGVGSLEDGAFASAMAITLLGQWFESIASLKGIGTGLLSTVLEINRKIVTTTEERGIKTASTLSAILLVESSYYVVHAGDSRIYKYNDGTLRQLTEDHVKEGKLTACIGRTKTIPLFYNEGRYRDDVFLLCSDGLYKRMEQEQIGAYLSEIDKAGLQQTIDQMASFVINRGEKDNISIAILMNR